MGIRYGNFEQGAKRTMREVNRGLVAFITLNTYLLVLNIDVSTFFCVIIFFSFVRFLLFLFCVLCFVFFFLFFFVFCAAISFRFVSRFVRISSSSIFRLVIALNEPLKRISQLR